MSVTSGEFVPKRPRGEAASCERNRRTYLSSEEKVADHARIGDSTHEAALPSTFLTNDAEDKVVTLNIGGTVVTTLASTLSTYPSRFTQWLKSDFDDLPRDSDERPFIDRDIDTFRHVLNYLRGYGLPTKSEDLVLLAQDAVYYEFENMKTDIGINSPSVWRFNPGPGVQADGTLFTVADILGLCGSEPLSTRQTHTIVFRIDKCELIEIGLIDFDNAKENCPIHKQKNSVCYCNTGELIRYWAEEPLYTPGTPFKAQDLITVRIRFLQNNDVLGTHSACTGEPAACGVSPITNSAITTPTPSAHVYSNNRGGSDRDTDSAHTVDPGIMLAAREANRHGMTAGAFVFNDSYSTHIPSRGGRSLVNLHRYAAIHNANSSDSNNNSANDANLVTSPLQRRELTSRSPSVTAHSHATISPPATGTEAIDVVFAQPNILTTATLTTPSDTTTVTTMHTTTTATTTGANGNTEVEDASTIAGAIITFSKENKIEFEAHWPIPVPPLQFAVSMQGTSSVSIVDSSSVDEGMDANPGQCHASSLYYNHMTSNNTLVRGSTHINADDIFAMLPIVMTGSS